MRPTVVENKTYTISVNFTNGNLDFFDSYDELKMYSPTKIHLHAPSEHTFNGKHYDLEIHIVHKDYKSSNLAVLALFFDINEGDGGNIENAFLTALMLDKQNPLIKTLPLGDLIDRFRKKKLYTYQGSLTIPPCSEIVTWIINDEP